VSRKLHPDGATLQSWVEGDLSGDPHRHVADHLGACPACSGEAQTLSLIFGELKALEQQELPDPGPLFSRQVMTGILKEEARQRVRRNRVALPAAVAAFAAMVLALLLMPAWGLNKAGPAMPLLLDAMMKIFQSGAVMAAEGLELAVRLGRTTSLLMSSLPTSAWGGLALLFFTVHGTLFLCLRLYARPQVPGARLGGRPGGGLILMTLLLLLAPALPAAATPVEPNTIYGRDLVIEAGEVVDRDVMVVFGSVTVDGVAKRDVVTFGGSVKVRGEVSGSVIALGGSADVLPGGVVSGDLICFGGTVSREVEERVAGKVVMLGSPGKLFGLGGDAEDEPPASLLSSLRWPLVLLLGWLVVTLVVGLAFPGQVAVAAGELARRPLFNGLAGLLGVAALSLSLAASVLLSVFIVGIPLLVIFFVAGLVVKAFGMVAVFHLTGRLTGGRFSDDPNPLLLTLLGFLLLGLVRLVPWAGQLVWTLAGVMGIGVSLTTKLGSGEPWFRSRG